MPWRCRRPASWRPISSCLASLRAAPATHRRRRVVTARRATPIIRPRRRTGGAPMSARLLWRSTAMLAAELPPAASIRVGSAADADVRVDAPGVRPAHATIARDGDRVLLVGDSADAAAVTWLNGRRVSRESLQHLDVITLGARRRSDLPRDMTRLLASASPRARADTARGRVRHRHRRSARAAADDHRDPDQHRR